jgi:hypothetical protein
MVMLNLPRRAAGSRRTSTHCHQGADFELKTPLDSYMLLNAIEEQKRATPLWIFACQPPRGDRDQKMAGGSVQMRHIILFSIAAVVLAGVAAWVVTSIQSQRTPTVSQFDPFSLEEKAKNLPTQEWLDRNMWPNNVD